MSRVHATFLRKRELNVPVQPPHVRGAFGQSLVPFQKFAKFATAMLMLALMTGVATARNGDEALNHYGLVTLSDNATGARLAARFKARGQPVFLVHDLNAGLSQNDIMRFADKAVLVDADVWSTLQAEGALAKLQAAPLVRVQGRATAESWEQRADIVSSERQRKAFKVGAELLRVLEENFGGAPQGQQFSVVFEQNHLALIAPNAMLDQLKFSAVRKVQPTGRPRIISTRPDSLQFTDQPFEYRVWGADPTDPSGELTYQITGQLPPGLTWNAATHTLRGTPTTTGRWRLSAIAQNRGGLRDTLAFTLAFRSNRAPFLAGEPRAVAVAEREWRFDITPADPDHPGYALRIRPGTLPTGMRFHSDSLYLRWTPAAALAGTRHMFTLTVEDPLGARREFRYTVQVVAKEGILLSEGVRIELPWDTLVRGRSYTWKTRGITSAWAGQGILLQSIEGPDTTLYDGDSLRMRPMSAGVHQLDFRFTAQGTPLLQSLFLPVREDHPPEFVTEISEWRLKVGDAPRRYRPVAIDPEGEVVSLEVQLPEGSPLQWDGKRLLFNPTERGTHTARIIARDAGGKTADQWVVLQAVPEKAGASWVVESRVHGELTAWTLTRDYGTGRIGLYSPNFTYGTLPWSYWLYRETPYLFIGGNLMGRKAEAQGRYLWADIGMAFSNPAPRIYAGGIYTRLNAQWYFPNSPLSHVEMETVGHIHRAMGATDSTTLFSLVADPTDIIARDRLSQDGPLSRLLRDGFREDNVRLFTRIEALGPLGYGFTTGPSLWREDMPLAEESVQRLGAALRYSKVHDSNAYQLTMRLGWAPGGGGWAAYGTMRMLFGAPF